MIKEGTNEFLSEELKKKKSRRLQETEALITNVPMSLGKHLCTLREAALLTPKAVADRLHLCLSTIELLEKDLWPGKLHLTFVRGYVRNYAALLGVEPKVLLTWLPSEAEDDAIDIRPVLPRKFAAVGGLGFALKIVLSLLSLYFLYIIWNEQHNLIETNLEQPLFFTQPKSLLIAT